MCKSKSLSLSLQKSPQSVFRNQRGQGLIEYLIIVALMGVATIGIMRVMQQTVSSRFASVTSALQGEKKAYEKPRIDPSMTQSKDMGTFFNGVDAGDSKGGSRDSAQ